MYEHFRSYRFDLCQIFMDFPAIKEHIAGFRPGFLKNMSCPKNAIVARRQFVELSHDSRAVFIR